MSSYVLWKKSGQILGAGSTASIDTSELLEKTVADVAFVNEICDKMRGTLNLGGYKITNLGAATDPGDAMRKQDAVTASGAIFTGDINMGGYNIKNYGTPSEDHDVTDKTYVEGRLVTYVNTNALLKNTDVYLGTAKMYYSITLDPLKQLIDVTYANNNYLNAPNGAVSNNIFLTAGSKIYNSSVVDPTKELVDRTYIDSNHLSTGGGTVYGDILMTTGATIKKVSTYTIVNGIMTPTAYSEYLTKQVGDSYYLTLNGGTLNGELSFNNLAKIVRLKDPDVAQDAATKNYVDSRVNMGTSISNPYTTDMYIQNPKKLFYYTPPLGGTGATTSAILDIDTLRAIFLAKAGDTITDSGGLKWNISVSDIVLNIETAGSPSVVTDKRLATLEYVETRLSTRLTKLGQDSMQGNLNLGNNKIINLADPIDLQDAATKAYVNSRTASGGAGTYLPLGGGTVTGDLILGMGMEMKYLINIVGGVTNYDLPIRASGAHPMTGNFNLNNNRILNVTDPVLDQDAATKAYADQKLPRQGGTLVGNTFMANGAQIYNSLTADATKVLVDKSQVLLTTGGTLTGKLTVSGSDSLIVNRYAGGAESPMLDVLTGDGRYLSKSGGTLTGNLVLGTTATLQQIDPITTTAYNYGEHTFLNLDGSKAMTGNINMATFKLYNLGDPANNQDAVTKLYLTSYYLPLAGGNIAGNINLANMYKITNVPTPTDNGDATSKSYVDSRIPASFLSKTNGHYYGTPAGSTAQGRIKNIEDPTEQQNVVTKQHLDYSARTTVINMANYAIKNLGFDGSTTSAMSYGMFLSFSVNKYIHYKMSYRQVIANPSLWISGSFPEQFDLSTDYYTDVRFVNTYNFANANTDLTRVGTIYRIKETINGNDYYYLSFDGSQQLTESVTKTDFDGTQVDSRTTAFVGTATIKTGYTIVYICRKNVVPTASNGRSIGSLQSNAPIGYWNTKEDVAWVNENIYGVDATEQKTATTAMHCYILRVSSAGVCDLWDFNRVIKLNKTITNPAFGTLAIGRDSAASEAGPFYLYELWIWKTNLSDLQLNQVRSFISVHYPFT